MKRLFVFLFFLFCGVAHSAQIVNVEYIHNAIAQKWDITIPYNSELTNPRVAANMKYLLTAVDVANEMLNGEKTTDYGNGEFATTVAADTIATDTAVDGLIVKGNSTDYKLKLTHDYKREGYSGNIRDPNHLIMISAAGTYNINWGDGTNEVIEKNTVGEQWFGHEYASDGIYTVRIGGQATKYSDDPDLSTVILGTSYACLDEWGSKCPLGITDINGCLGCVFPTLEDGSQPRFIGTFADAYDLNIDIPSGLFSGIHGAPVENMFKRTFNFAYITAIPSDLFSGIQGPPAEGMFEGTFSATYIESIPENLFAGIQGPPAKNMFANTFNEVSIESIPENLFVGIQGPPAEGMFEGTFNACMGLTAIPENLFAGIQGPPAEGMFYDTFQYTGLTSIPENLFAGLDTTAPATALMFESTFAWSENLTGPSARINGQYLYEIWPDDAYYYGTYSGCEGLSDYANIPDAWK